MLGPDIYRRIERFQYFLDPKLVWFVANNPTLVERMPPNMPDLAQLMIERGAKAADLDYTLELVMTGSAAREACLQRPLMSVLLDAGATASTRAVEMTAAHRELDALEVLVERGRRICVRLAAAFGDLDALRASLRDANLADVQSAFGLAAINERIGAVRLTIEAGADVNAFLPIHVHGTALHQAAGGTNTELIALLLDFGARRETRDRLWDATPLEWAHHGGNAIAAAALTASPER